MPDWLNTVEKDNLASWVNFNLKMLNNENQIIVESE